ncbi:hypothetical protein BJY01DRAFT_255524 [Aspergillus pseudoustus]|uniref:Uncharacterized protein n=1 Tax=Aspergillus pseudoustus TaxID=1810923 RepID=A0ABR4ILY0_9EURO
MAPRGDNHQRVVEWRVDGDKVTVRVEDTFTYERKDTGSHASRPLPAGEQYSRTTTTRNRGSSRPHGGGFIEGEVDPDPAGEALSIVASAIGPSQSARSHAGHIHSLQCLDCPPLRLYIPDPNPGFPDDPSRRSGAYDDLNGTTAVHDKFHFGSHTEPARKNTGSRSQHPRSSKSAYVEDEEEDVIGGRDSESETETVQSITSTDDAPTMSPGRRVRFRSTTRSFKFPNDLVQPLIPSGTAQA